MPHKRLRYLRASATVALIIAPFAAFGALAAYWALSGDHDPASDSGLVQGVVFLSAAAAAIVALAAIALPVLAWVLDHRGMYSVDRFLQVVLLFIATTAVAVAVGASVVSESLTPAVPAGVAFFFAGAVLIAPLAGVWARFAE